MKVKISSIVFLIGCFFSATQIFAQESAEKKCKSNVKGGRYEYAEIASWYRQPDHISGRILIKPKNVNKDFLVLLAKRLKSEYCNAKYLLITIYDNADLMNYGWEIYNKPEKEEYRMRGIYTFDMKTGLDKIEFSTKSGNPVDENVIDLAAILSNKPAQD